VRVDGTHRRSTRPLWAGEGATASVSESILGGSRMAGMGRNAQKRAHDWLSGRTTSDAFLPGSRFRAGT
jgi:hypothetical protein